MINEVLGEKNRINYKELNIQPGENTIRVAQYGGFGVLFSTGSGQLSVFGWSYTGGGFTELIHKTSGPDFTVNAANQTITINYAGNTNVTFYMWVLQ